MRLLLLAALLMSAPAAAVEVKSGSSTDAHGGRIMVHSVEINASAKDVYEALTTPEGWRRWAVAVAWQVEDQPRVIETSYDAKAQPGGPATIRQLFLREEPGRLVEFRTIKAPQGFEEFDTYSKVVNRVELRPLGPARTLVRFSAGPYPDTPAGRKLYGFFEDGNRKTLENMAKVLGGGEWSRFAERRSSN